MTTTAQNKPACRKTTVVPKTARQRPTAEATEATVSPAVPPSPAKQLTSIVSTASALPEEPASGIRPKPGSKLGIVLALLEEPQGASLARLVEETGWLPHTTRAALTGLRKRGFAVVSEKTEGGGASVYRVRSEVA